MKCYQVDQSVVVLRFDLSGDGKHYGGFVGKDLLQGLSEKAASTTTTSLAISLFRTGTALNYYGIHLSIKYSMRIEEEPIFGEPKKG